MPKANITQKAPGFGALRALGRFASVAGAVPKLGVTIPKEKPVIKTAQYPQHPPGFGALRALGRFAAVAGAAPKLGVMLPKEKTSHKDCFFLLEAPPGFGPGNRGFAVRCLTTWRWRHIRCAGNQESPQIYFYWSGLRGSNSLPPPWQGGALPDELKPHLVPQARVELATRGFSVRCSTN